MGLLVITPGQLQGARYLSGAFLYWRNKIPVSRYPCESRNYIAHGIQLYNKLNKTFHHNLLPSLSPSFFFRFNLPTDSPNTINFPLPPSPVPDISKSRGVSPGGNGEGRVCISCDALAIVSLQPSFFTLLFISLEKQNKTKSARGWVCVHNRLFYMVDLLYVREERGAYKGKECTAQFSWSS